MTLAPETQRTLQEVAVLFTPDPDRKPLAIRFDGHVWAVNQDVHAAHWFTRDAWWKTRNRAAIGTGNVVSIEYWQVQAKVSSNAELRTFTLRREPQSTQWQLESIS
jgi:hypothetical protein